MRRAFWFVHPIFIFIFSIIALGLSLFLYIYWYVEVSSGLKAVLEKTNLDPQQFVAWQTWVGRGGIQGGVHFGMATSGDSLYVGVSDMADGRTYDLPQTPGLRSVNLKTGELEWFAPAPEDVCNNRQFCHPGISQAVTSVNGMVFAGGMDGVMRVHNGADGALLMELDSTEDFATVNGQSTNGGSFGGAAGPIVQDGLVVLSSGYGIYNHMAGNLLLVLEAGE